MDSLREIPLFPLRTVLFPNSTIELRVADEPYKQIVTKCLDSGSDIGVFLTRSSYGSYKIATQNTVGTLAEISGVRHFAKNELSITITGKSRFRVDNTIQNNPYQIATVEAIPELVDITHGALSNEVYQSLDIYLGLVSQLQGEWIRDFDLPDDPTQLSFAVGTSIIGSITRKQQILEATTVQQRLQIGLNLLKRETRRLKQELSERHYLRSSSN